MRRGADQCLDPGQEVAGIQAVYETSTGDDYSAVTVFLQGIKDFFVVV